MSPDRFVLSCEHGGNRIPRTWSSFFASYEAELASHRGWDAGALPLASLLARAVGAPLHAVTVSRLLCDTNRREGHPRLFGAPVRKLPAPLRERILAEHHRPHRTGVRAEVEGIVAEGERAVHLSIHTFTPVLDGVPRPTGIGLLYDPAREGERRLCTAWTDALRRLRPGLRMHRNRPYRGTSDGLTGWLRERFPEDAYVGVEIEVRRDLLAPGNGGGAPSGDDGGAAESAVDEIAALLLDGLAAAQKGEAGS